MSVESAVGTNRAERRNRQCRQRNRLYEAQRPEGTADFQAGEATGGHRGGLGSGCLNLFVSRGPIVHLHEACG